MKGLKKIALAAAVAAAPFSVNALEALDDEFLGDVTGQEGITIDQTYMNTIEEFKYVDADGDGSGTQGEVSLTDIRIGNFAGASFWSGKALGDAGVPGQTAFDSGAATLGNTQVVGKTIDATANGVLLGAGHIGTEATVTINDGVNNALPIPFNSDVPTTDASGNMDALALIEAGAGGATLFTDNARKLRGFGDGRDTYVGGIELGNENGSQNSIGSLTILNQGNYAGSGRVLTAINKFNVGGGFAGNGIAIMNTNANQWIEANTLISSKASGTGVVITSEGGGGAQAIYYTDTDTGGGSVGIIGLSQFRLINAGDDWDADMNNATGTVMRGALTETTIDVEDGKLTLAQKKQGNTIINKIFVGDVNVAGSLAANQDASAQTLGGIAIMGNVWEGTTSIYAH